MLHCCILYKYKKKASHLNGYRIDCCTNLKTAFLKHHHRCVVNAGTWGSEHLESGLWNIANCILRYSIIFILIKEAYLLGK